MEWIDDSKACLDVSEVMLNDLEEQIKVSINQPDLIPYIKVNIKNILENCRSPLDYSAVYVFDTFCRSEYNSNTEIRKKRAAKPSFVITEDAKTFKNDMENRFKNLYKHHPEIYNVFKSAQSFNGDPWLDNLTALVNTNKHRNLSKHRKEHIATINHYAEDIYGNVFANNTIIGNPESAIMVNGQSVTGSNAANNPYFKKYNATFYYEFIFTDLDSPVIKTLEDIYNGAKNVINELESILEGN